MGHLRVVTAEVDRRGVRSGLTFACCAAFLALSFSALLAVAAAPQTQAQARPGDPVPSPVFTPGEDGVTPPKLIHSVKAQYSDEARKARYEGTCLVRLIVDARGMPRGVRVIRVLGMGLDENAVKAVRQYRFKPGTYNGRPVAVKIQVEVNFRTP